MKAAQPQPWNLRRRVIPKAALASSACFEGVICGIIEQEIGKGRYIKGQETGVRISTIQNNLQDSFKLKAKARCLFFTDLTTLYFFSIPFQTLITKLSSGNFKPYTTMSSSTASNTGASTGRKSTTSSTHTAPPAYAPSDASSIKSTSSTVKKHLVEVFTRKRA
ncbi:hypothetical protein EJ07DRAFT_180278 [Lizonia empirigonia]|nr:hypothetical protein EJ07DRAFT_180278 [Lizonia empirigonia]